MKCEECNSDYESGFGKKSYCSKKCYIRVYHRKYYSDKKSYEKECDLCKKNFLGSRGQILCSKECFYKRRCDVKYKTGLLKIKYSDIDGLNSCQRYRKFNPEKGVFELDKDNMKRVVVIQYLGGKCIKCGYDEDIRALQLDHIRGDGKEDRKRLGSRVCRYYVNNLEEAKLNLQVYCANCHAIKTYIMEERTRKILRKPDRNEGFENFKKANHKK